MGIVTIPDIDVLRSRGVMVRVNSLDEAGNRVLGSDGSPVLVNEYFYFTNWSVAGLESPAPMGFGSLEEWQESMTKTPNRTTMKTVALMRDKTVLSTSGDEVPDIRWAANLLIDGEMSSYGLALSTAMMLAQGVSPEATREAGQMMLRQQKKATQEAHAEMLKQFAEEEEDATTPTSHNESPSSPSTYVPGLLQEDQSMSSGD